MGGYGHWLHGPFQGGMGKTYSRYWISFRGRIGGTGRGDLGFKVFFLFFEEVWTRDVQGFGVLSEGCTGGMGKGH